MTVDATISEVLDTLKPAGTRWVVWVNDSGFKSCYGPFDEYKGAQDWVAKHTPAGDVEVLPLYDRS